MKHIHLPYDDNCHYNPLSGYAFGEFKYHSDGEHFLDKYHDLFGSTKIKLDISCAIDLKKFNILFKSQIYNNVN